MRNVGAAALAWQHRQASTLAGAYTASWHAGAAGYRSTRATPPAAGLTATSPAPVAPAPAATVRALGPALAGVARMAATLALITPTAAGIAAAGSVAAATAAAAAGWLARNLWRLAAGASVVWAGEQHGYAQAAAADGMLLAWQLDPSPAVHHCEDCPALAALPPMVLDQWPTLPGEGATACDVGCRCSMLAVAARPRALTADQLQLLSRIANRQPVLA